MVILKDDPKSKQLVETRAFYKTNQINKNKVKHERLNATYIIKNKHI